MTPPVRYEIVIRGRVSARFFRPLLGDFIIVASGATVTRLVGEVVDTSHLHGLLAHLTSVNVEIISVTPVDGIPGING